MDAEEREARPVLPRARIRAREEDLGRKKLSYSTIGRGTTTARGAQPTMQQRDDVRDAKENLTAAQEDLDALNAELEEKIARIRVT